MAEPVVAGSAWHTRVHAARYCCAPGATPCAAASAAASACLCCCTQLSATAPIAILVPYLSPRRPNHLPTRVPAQTTLTRTYTPSPSPRRFPLHSLPRSCCLPFPPPLALLLHSLSLYAPPSAPLPTLSPCVHRPEGVWAVAELIRLGDEEIKLVEVRGERERQGDE